MRRVVVGAGTGSSTGGRRRLRRQRSPATARRRAARAPPKAADANKHVNIAHFVAIQSNPVEQVIINSSKDTGKANNATVTTLRLQQRRAERDRQLQGRDRLEEVRRVRRSRPSSGPPLIPCARAAIKAGIPVVV